MNKFVVTLLSLTLAGCNGLDANIDLSYNSAPAPCLSQPKTNPPRDPQLNQIVEKSLKTHYASPYSLWDQNTLKSNHKLSQALKDYSEGKKGLSVKNLHLTHKTPQYIHHKLLQSGFNHHRVPLIVNPNVAHKEYWRKNGLKTSQATAKDIVYMDIYSHKDGGIVRVKPLGIPDLHNPRPHPHAAKSVMLDQHANNPISWQNEAFKVSDDGYPIPKAPNREYGLKLNEPDILKHAYNTGTYFVKSNILEAWKDIIMDNAHIDIKVDFSHCKR